MAEPPRYPEAGAEPERESNAGAPRWVKVFGVIAVVLVLLIGIMLLSGGNHGPGRHTGSGDAGGPSPASEVTESGGAGGHQPPAGGHAPE